MSKEVRLALLEQSVKIVQWALAPIGTAALIAGTFAWNSQATIVRLESENDRMRKDLIEIVESLNLTNTDIGESQEWVEENFVSKDVFEATRENKKEQ